MVDVYNLIFTTLYNGIHASYPDVDVKNEYIDESANFPCITVTEDSQTDYRRSMGYQLEVPHARLMVAVNVYTNSEYRQSEARTLMSKVDEIMHGMKFTKTFCQPTPNIDRTIYRMTARYEIVVREGEQIGNNIVFQVYRS